MFEHNEMQFELIENKRDCFDEEVFKEKYTEVLDKYDYVLGDVVDNQLRLKGFYDESSKSFENNISYVAYYLHAFCSYGTAYYVIKKTAKKQDKPRRNKKKRNNYSANAKKQVDKKE